MYFDWQTSQPNVLRCVDKYHETADTVTLHLADLTEECLFEFKPGQFITLGVEIEGQWHYRAYSLSSLSCDDELHVTIKRVEGGLVSNYIVDSLLIGDEVRALAPTGAFNCIDFAPQQVEGEPSKVLLISAGCGITPVFAMARHWLDQSVDVDIEFLHIARSPQETIYLKRLKALDEQHDNFHLKLLLKQSGASGYPQGRLDQAWLSKLVPDAAQRSVYLCGPSQFMADVKGYLAALGADMAHFHQESFTPSEQGATQTEQRVDAQTDAEQVADPQVDVEQGKSAVNVEVPDFATHAEAQHGDVLADVLENAGLPLIVACRSGICGSCKCKVTRGSVVSSSLETLSADEIEQGYVLACSSTIESDLAVSLG